MAEIDLSAENLNSEISLINSIGSEFRNLSSAMNGVDCGGVGLTSEGLFNEAKTLVSNVINGDAGSLSFDELKKRIQDVRDVLIKNNADISSLFTELDGMSLEEFGNFNLGTETNSDSALIDYLKNNFGTYKQLDNGGYYVKDATGNEYYFSADCSIDDIHLTVYFPGGGGAKGDAGIIRQDMEKGGVPSKSAYAVASDSRSYKNLFDKFDTIANNTGITVDGVQAIGFSASGGVVFDQLNGYLESHPEIKDASLICVDGYEMDNVYNSSYNALIERNVPVYMFSPTYTKRVDDVSSKLSDKGLNVFVVSDKTNASHGELNKKVLRDGFMYYLAGKRDSVSNISDYAVDNKYSKMDNLLINNLFNIDVNPITQPKENIYAKEPLNDSPNLQPKNNSDIAHRGYSPGGVWENSAEAFRLAGENGFWGCETDVRFDADGNLICSHNAPKSSENLTSFSEYLDICKEYGMTAVIDLKYAKGAAAFDSDLSPAVIQTIKDKGMLDSCVIQTNNPYDVPYIRENSSDARIWYLTDLTNDSTLNLAKENDVECVNIQNGRNNTHGYQKLTDNGIDVCVWNVWGESSKKTLLDNGVKYVMSDNVLGITPYQEGEVDFNAINSNSNKTNPQTSSVKSNDVEAIKTVDNNSEASTLAGTLDDGTFKSSVPVAEVPKTTTRPTTNPTSPVTETPKTAAKPTTSVEPLTAPVGYIDYDRTDGRHVTETWCDLPVSQLITNMKEDHGIDMEYSIREDGVRMYGPYVMVAADVPYMGGGNEEAEYRYGDIVETSLGTGMIVDFCERAVNTRKASGGQRVHYDIYTAWHEQPYQSMVYADDYVPVNHVNDALFSSTGETNSNSNVTASPVETINKDVPSTLTTAVSPQTVASSEITTEAVAPKVGLFETVKAASPQSRESSKPVVETSKPKVEPSKPAVETSVPTVKSSNVTAETSVPKAEPSKSVIKNSTQIEETLNLVMETSSSTVESSKPVLETSAQTVKSSNSAVETSTPKVEPSKPVIENSMQTVEPSDLVNEISTSTMDNDFYDNSSFINEPVSHTGSNVDNSNVGKMVGGVIAGLIGSIGAFFTAKFAKKHKNSNNDDEYNDDNF